MSPRTSPPLHVFIALWFCALPLFAKASHGRVIAENSFEEPSVSGNAPKANAAAEAPPITPDSPLRPDLWESLEDHPNLGPGCGSIVAGLTSRAARSGTQSLFVEAAGLNAPYLAAQWTSRPIPIEAGKYYRITLWGCDGTRSPAREPAAAAPLYLTFHVAFYESYPLAATAETGENLYLVVPLRNPPGHGASLSAGCWTPLKFEFEAPAKAAFFRVSFQCGGHGSKGPLNATVYFDDFTVSEEIPPLEGTTIAGAPGWKLHRSSLTKHHRKRFICLPLAGNQAK